MSGVRSLDIHWLAGSVTIRRYDGATVRFSEDLSSDAPEADRLHYKMEDGTLRMYSTASGVRYSTLYVKHLVLEIPEDCRLTNLATDLISASLTLEDIAVDNADLQSVSGNVKLRNCTMNAATLDQVSGDIRIEQTTLGTLAVNGVSGNINATGLSVSNFDMDTVSGNGSFAFASPCPLRSFDIDTVSGDITLYWPEELGFTAKVEGISKHFTSDYACQFSDSTAVYGDGAVTISLDAVSGDLRICRPTS